MKTVATIAASVLLVLAAVFITAALFGNLGSHPITNPQQPFVK
jgi:hypothetical protein